MLRILLALSAILASANAFSSAYARVRHVSAVQTLANPAATRPHAVIGQRRSQLQMGNNAAFGLFSPAVLAAKAVLGDKTLNKLRGKGISLHSQVCPLAHVLIYFVFDQTC